MALERITLFRGQSEESKKVSELLNRAKASNLFKRNSLHFVEIYYNPPTTKLPPTLVKRGDTYKGYNEILKYIVSLDHHPLKSIIQEEELKNI